MESRKVNPQGSLEEALMRELRFGKIDEEHLKELVGIVADIQRTGLKGIKVFPTGIPPVVDGLRVSGVVDAGEANKILNQIFTTTPHLGEVTLFPYGIPLPEIFKVNINVGATVEAGQNNRF